RGPTAHHVLITAFLNDEVRCYTIDLALTPNGLAFRYTRHIVGKDPAIIRAPRVGITGSGAWYLVRDKKWMRSLLGVVKANARGQISSVAVADHLAQLNNQVHLGITDKSVGPRCIVAWRNKKGSANGGGAHQ